MSASEPNDAGETTCFHCGEPIPAGVDRSVVIDGERHPVCCAGCEAVATLIGGCELDAFYRFRTAASNRPEPVSEDEWRAFDREAMQNGFVVAGDDGSREAALLIEGLNCGACAWLIEHVVAPLPGVLDIQVNPASARALLRWNPAHTPLSALLAAIARLGYRPHPVGADDLVPVATRERRAALKRLLVAGLGMMQVMMYAVALYAGAIHEDMAPGIEQFLRIVSLIVATPVVCYSARPFFRGAWRDLRASRPGMDVPVALAVGGAYAASVWHTLFGGGEVYFDSVTMFVFFLTVARFLEMTARHRSGRATEALTRTIPATALRIHGATAERVALAELQPGDRVRVAAGEAIPADGHIEQGRSHVDESMLTGEFLPVARTAGDTVRAGSVNVTAPVAVRVERVGRDTLLAGVVRLLERAQTERPEIARVADRAAGWFVAGVLAAAAITGAVWWRLDPASAFDVTLAVLVVTCPCALSLATPAAVVAATSRLARRGLLVTRAQALETLLGVDRVVLDKTGTLTHGRMAVVDTQVENGAQESACLALAAALEAHSAHPVARAFESCREGDIEAGDVRESPGYGVEGVVDGRRLRIGRPDWVARLAGAPIPGPGRGTQIALGDEHGILARFQLEDRLRRDAAGVVSALRAAGVSVEIASGDCEGAVAALAQRLGISDWQARMTPEMKLARIRGLQAAGHRVAAVGDGINDAPVLAGADVSVAMGAGSALARRSADIVLLGDRLVPLLEARDTARRMMAIIRENLGWAVVYNTLALPLAAAGFVAPWMAAIGMSLSSLLVVGNALRLNRDRKPGARAQRRASDTASGVSDMEATQ